VNCGKTAEPIELPFGMVSGETYISAQWCHLANTVERLRAAAVNGSATVVATRPVPKKITSGNVSL